MQPQNLGPGSNEDQERTPTGRRRYIARLAGADVSKPVLSGGSTAQMIVSRETKAETRSVSWRGWKCPRLWSQREWSGAFAGSSSCFLHARLQGTDALSDALAQLRQFLRTKNQQGNKEDHQQMHWLKQAFKHKNLRCRQAGSKPNTIETTHLRQLSQRPQRGRPTAHYLRDLPLTVTGSMLPTTAGNGHPRKKGVGVRPQALLFLLFTLSAVSALGRKNMPAPADCTQFIAWTAGGMSSQRLDRLAHRAWHRILARHCRFQLFVRGWRRASFAPKICAPHAPAGPRRCRLPRFHVHASELIQQKKYREAQSILQKADRGRSEQCRPALRHGFCSAAARRLGRRLRLIRNCSVL